MDPPPLAHIFNSTHADFDAVTPLVWGPTGEAMAARAGILPGQRVLDVCSGTGASALAAARLVGPAGSVTAVDFAGDLLARAHAKASAAELHNVEFRVADVTDLRADDIGHFDVLTCGYGVFFLPEMDAAVRNLIDLLLPGGRLSLAVWHDDALYDFAGAYFARVARVTGEPTPPGPRDPVDDPHPITRIDTVEKITAWLESVGAVDTRATVLRLRIPRTDTFGWSMVLGSGLRGALDGLSPEAIAEVRRGFLQDLADADMTEVNCDTLIATGRRPER
ncbi:class I SAM-dependent methyltransferase [Millisia brevis]|uniref:class I SAM-dependent methyltransferase n=1 Tax=Millisia brevis TaxID=264148 RepID=UPI0012ED51D4|nr:class I SAM-dependent methyltransferase [Millisia brevis]